MVGNDTLDERTLLRAGFRYALSLRHDRHDAEDLAQEAWCRLHRKAGGIDSKAHLFAAIRNLHIDRYRRENLVVFVALEEADAVADDAPLIDDQIRPAELDPLLRTLRDAEREALFLHVVEGYTAQEIADLTERSRGTVLSLIHRTKAKLARALNAKADRTRQTVRSPARDAGGIVR